MYKNISIKEFREAIQKDENAVILDVRTPDEWASGIIHGARLINFFDPQLTDNLKELDKSKSYYCICRSGNRSSAVCGMMESMGFEKLYNVSNGMMHWDGELEVPSRAKVLN